ncbi:hypothetical protein ACFYSF_29825, partial [Streptomyces canus]
RALRVNPRRLPRRRTARRRQGPTPASRSTDEPTCSTIGALPVAAREVVREQVVSVLERAGEH